MARRYLLIGIVALLLLGAVAAYRSLVTQRPASPPSPTAVPTVTDTPTPAPTNTPGERGTPKPDMVSVPAGPFFMGCNAEVDSECADDEKPGGEVTVAAFEIDRNEVTVDDYRRCVNAGACSTQGLDMPFFMERVRPDVARFCNWTKPQHDHDPINCIDWQQAKTFCEWLGKRLPTQQEWEKAARGTDGRKYPWGNTTFADAGAPVANIADESARRQFPAWVVADGYDDGFAETAPVGSYTAGASPYGALDMIGNVWEWTTDEVPGGRAVRGGSWDAIVPKSRVSKREPYDQRARNVQLGLRCVRSLEGGTPSQ